MIDPQDLAQVKRQIDRVYEDGDFVGSLVVPEDGRTRPTEWQRIRRQWLSGVVMPQPMVTQPVVQPVVHPVVVPVSQPIPYVTQVSSPNLPFLAAIPGTSIPFDLLFAAFVRTFAPD